MIHKLAGSFTILLMMIVMYSMASLARAENEIELESPSIKGAVAEQAESIPAVVQAAYGEKIRSVRVGSKLIALTFDDGPHPTRTAQVLAILKEHDVTANFFWIGKNVRLHPEVARQVVAAGHEVGNHSMSHPNLRKQSLKTVRKEIGDTQALIEKTTGYRPYMFRPPGGSVNRSVQDVCREEKLAICMWSVDPKDWASGSSPQSIHDTVMRTAHSGAIVCMHDIKANTVKALPGIIRDLKAEGYELTTISRLMAARVEKVIPSAAAAGGSAVNPPMDLSSPLTISLDESEI